MNEVVDNDIRFGRLIVPCVKVPRIPPVFSHEAMRSLDLGIKCYDLISN
jgi:hypothetical protein